MTLFARRMLMASAGAAILAVYTIAAIVASGSRSLPFIAIEIAIVAYLMLLRLRRHRNLQIKCPALPTQPIVRVVCVCIVIAFHLVVVALLGPFSSERWLPDKLHAPDVGKHFGCRRCDALVGFRGRSPVTDRRVPSERIQV